jgi:hypothetical protein
MRKIYDSLKFLTPFVVGTELMLPQMGLAQSVSINITGPSGVLCRIATQLFWILIVLSTIMVLYAAFIYLTAGENSQNVSKAHKTLAYAAIGVVVALLAKSFPLMISSVVGATLPAGATC